MLINFGDLLVINFNDELFGIAGIIEWYIHLPRAVYSPQTGNLTCPWAYFARKFYTHKEFKQKI